MKFHSTKASRTGIALAVGSAAVVAMSGWASASTVTVDGILTPGEYLGGTEGVDHGTINLPWYNDHHSTYVGQSNDLHWEISGDPGAVMLNIYFEVPGYARRMIWDDGCEYDDGVASGCASLTQDLKDDHGLTDAEVKAVYDAYEDNHHGDINFSFNTQTGSEEFELKGNSGSIFFADWDYSSGPSGSANANLVETKNSLDYLLANGCSTTFCSAFDFTPSIEVKWMFDEVADAVDVLSDITAMRLHLSDEARGLPVLSNTPTPPPSAVPLPASLPLLGVGLACVFGLSRRRKRAVS